MRGDTLPELADVMRRLLAPDGCPWDREQTLETLKPFLLEETYEVLEALDGSSPAHHCEELGDLLMQIVFQSALREAAGEFNLDDVVRAIAGKLVSRHPHVFADAKAETSGEVLAQWAELKAKEKAAKGEKPRRTLDGVPLAMPALARATRLTERAATVGFDWPDAKGPREKIDEELGELERAIASGDANAIHGELGDLLFSVVNLARKLGQDPEDALRGSTARFAARFAHVEDALAARGKTPKQSTLAEMDVLWNEAKGIVPQK